MKAKKTHEYRKKMILRLAKLGHSVRAGKYEDLPESVRFCYRYMSYMDIVTPLIILDHLEGKSYGELAIKYGIEIYQVRYVVCCKNEFLLDQNLNNQEDEK